MYIVCGNESSTLTKKLFILRPVEVTYFIQWEFIGSDDALLATV